jgi:hypothetical protein
MPTEGEAEAILRELAELKEHQSWVHHVADAATGKLVTSQLSRPVSPLSRAERLSRLGHQFSRVIFGAPTYRLTPRIRRVPRVDSGREQIFTARADEVMSSLTSANGMGTSRRLGNY